MSGSTSSGKVTLISSDGDEFEVDYKPLAMESGQIKRYYNLDEDLAVDCSRRCPLSRVPTKTLKTVIAHCTKTGDQTDYSKLKPLTLVHLTITACEMDIDSLLDRTCVALSDIINEMSPEDICKTLDITTDDFTPERAEELYISFPGVFQKKQRLSPDESARLTDQEKTMRNQQYFLQKVLPAVSPAQFKSLTPEEKKEWVQFAVYGHHWIKKIAKRPLYPTDGEKKPANLDKVSVRREGESQTITIDLTPLFVKKSRNEDLGSNKRVFQLLSVCVKFRTDKPGQLYGLIDAKSHGCSEFISLFNRGDYESQPISSNGLVSLTDPSPCGLISANGNIDMRVQLFVRLDGEDLKLSLVNLFWDCLSPLYNKNFGCFENVFIKTVDGSVKLYYIVLDNPVEATVDVLMSSHDSFYGFGKIVAYYGDLESYFHPSDKNQCLRFGTFKCGIEEAGYCKITLFEASRSDPVWIVDGKLPLTRSKLVVPNGGSLVIEADLEEIRFPQRNVNGAAVEIRSEPGGTSSRHINGLRCKMTVNVDWKTP